MLSIIKCLCFSNFYIGCNRCNNFNNISYTRRQT
nr:MAG TPA_asm: hypothetical protein [Caudoviricetes sp.]